LFGDLLAFVGPWCIESIVNYAYAVLEGNTTFPIEHQVVTLPTPYQSDNSSNITIDVPTSGEVLVFFTHSLYKYFKIMALLSACF